MPSRLFQNAHAYVNAAFKMKVTEDGKQILGRPALVFGGIDDKLVNIASYKLLTFRQYNSCQCSASSFI